MIRRLLPLVCLAAFAQTPEQRAVAYLAQEVPAWKRDNGCFSCHNNGDGARALFVARHPIKALAETTAWLEQPESWDKAENKEFKDRKLARVQFAAALVEADRAGLVTRRAALLEAARKIAEDQSPDGSWQIDTSVATGSPATYGTALATYLSRNVLIHAGAEMFRHQIEQAGRWLLEAKPVNILDHAALLLASPKRSDLLNDLLKAQNSDGGWGPQPNAPSEVFDTAIAILALHTVKQPQPVARARAFLVKMQQPGGGWPETTRPAGSLSYAQHISTSAWATLALLALDAESK